MKRFFFLFALVVGICYTLNAQDQLRLAGGDISLLPSYEQYNTPYKDQQGKTINDLVTYAAGTLGWNACRVRLFVDPCIINPNDNNRQGEVQDLTYVTALGKRIKDAGMYFLLDFHYSDTWADPVAQTIPEAWKNLSEEELLDTVYAYTRMCLRTLVDNGATPDYVQIGNEISYGILWRGKSASSVGHIKPWETYAQNPDGWGRFCGILNQGARAVREVCPQAQIIIHVERAEKANDCSQFYKSIESGEVDYDIIGLSYYPFWHGWLDTQLKNTLETLHADHPDKPIQIVETAYYNSNWPSSGIKFDTRTLYPATPAGQNSFLEALITKLDEYDYVNGLYYWFPEENGNGGDYWNANTIVIDGWLNRGLFNPNGGKHQAYAGLYTIGTYARTPISAVENVAPTYQDGQYYTLLGVSMGTDRELLPAGMYIHQGKKILVQK